MPVTTKSISVQNGHEGCFLCGEKNPQSLKLAFYADGDAVRAAFQPCQKLQGYKGILHGGVVASLLDAAMTHCLFHHHVCAVTGDLRVRFLQPVSCHNSLDLRAWILFSRPPMYHLKAELTVEKQVKAWAEAKFMQQQIFP